MVSRRIAGMAAALGVVGTVIRSGKYRDGRTIIATAKRHKQHKLNRANRRHGRRTRRS